jgi:hypothetical protein
MIYNLEVLDAILFHLLILYLDLKDKGNNKDKL